MPVTFDATFLVVTVLLTLRLSIVAALLPLISGRTVPVAWRLPWPASWPRQQRP